MAGREFSAWLDKYRYFFDPDNPFIRWLIILDVLILLAHVSMIYWVYRDASWRYNRGAPWALFAAIFPFGGWLFYILYRISPLPQFDRAEQDMFDEDDHDWNDYDEYRANRSSGLFQELYEASMEGSGYTAEQRQSRRRELRGQLSPEEIVARREQRLAERAQKKAARAENKVQRQTTAKQRKLDSRERSKMTARHGFSFRMSDRRQRQIKKQLQLLDTLKNLPREDQIIEEMIYEMDYIGARAAASDALEIATEMQDAQGIVTYERYVERIERMIAEELAEDAALDSPEQH
jgi:hypothetical protein